MFHGLFLHSSLLSFYHSFLYFWVLVAATSPWFFSPPPRCHFSTRSQGHQVTNSQISMSPVWLRSWLQARVDKEGKAKKCEDFGASWQIDVWLDWCLVLFGLPISFVPFLHINVETIKTWAPSNMSKKKYHYHMAILWVKCLPLHMDLEAQ